MQTYELVVIFKPMLFEDLKKSTISKIEDFVKKSKGNIKETDNMGKKLLAYPIKNFKEGYYVEYSVSLESKDVADFRRELNLAPDVLRFLMINK